MSETLYANDDPNSGYILDYGTPATPDEIAQAAGFTDAEAIAKCKAAALRDGKLLEILKGWTHTKWSLDRALLPGEHVSRTAQLNQLRGKLERRLNYLGLRFEDLTEEMKR